MAAITSAAQAAIAAASPGESKENTFHNKINALKTICDHSNKGFQEAVETVIYLYTIHPGTSSLTEEDGLDEMFWLPFDLLQWRWKQELEKLFPWWVFNYNSDGHYSIVPAEYVPPKERWEQCEATLREATFHTMYNLPNDNDTITYWDVYADFSHDVTTTDVLENLKQKDIHPEVMEWTVHRGIPTDLEELVWLHGEDDRRIHRYWQMWAQRGLEDLIVRTTGEVTGITLEDYMKKDTPPPLRRQATLVGKFYEGSDACPPREPWTHNENGVIMVDVRAPKSLLEWCQLEMAGTKDNPMWKQKKLPAGLLWMMDTIWAHLNDRERAHIKHELEYWRIASGSSVSIDRWLHIQLLHNFGDCFTEESKKKIKAEVWMLCPRTVKY